MSLITLVRFSLTRASLTTPCHAFALTRLSKSYPKETDNIKFGYAGACGFAAGAGAVTLLAAPLAAAEEANPSAAEPPSRGPFSWWRKRASSDGTHQPPPPQQQQQQQQQQFRRAPPITPESGAIPALTEEGLTNHPLDYNPITNEHTAAMTLAKQAAMEYYQRGKFKEAEKRFQEALGEARLGFPPDDPHIPSAMNNLAEFYRNTKQYDKAQQLYQQAIDQLIEGFGEKHWMVASAMCNLGLLMEEQGRYQEAQAVLTRTLEIRRQLFSAHTHPYADCAALLARVMMEVGGQQDQALQLYKAAVQIVEDTGAVSGTPILQWLLALAQIQMDTGRPADAVATLKKAGGIMMDMKISQDHSQGDAATAGSSSSSSSSISGSDQGMLGVTTDPGSSSSSSSGSGSGSGGGSGSVGRGAVGKEDAKQLARAKMMMEASEVAEKLVEALVAAGQVDEARGVMTACVEARMHLFGGHLLVAKSMTRLSQLLLLPPVAPDAPQQAVHFAAGAVTIAKNALGKARKPGSLVKWMFAGGNPVKTMHKMQALLQLGRGYQVLSQAHEAEGNTQVAVEALRKGVEGLRAGQAAAQEEVKGLAEKLPQESPVMDKLAGLLLDLKLLQLDLLEALAAALRQQLMEQGAGSQITATAAAPAGGGGGTPVGGEGGVSGGAGVGADRSTTADEVRLLLVEAETIAGELYGVS